MSLDLSPAGPGSADFSFDFTALQDPGDGQSWSPWLSPTGWSPARPMELVQVDGAAVPRLAQTRPTGDLLTSSFEQLRAAMAELARHGLAPGDLEDDLFAEVLASAF